MLGETQKPMLPHPSSAEYKRARKNQFPISISWNPAESLGRLGRTVPPWRCQAVVWLLMISGFAAFGQGTSAFTYQGQLHDKGTNANGAYTMIFGLYDARSGGNQIGPSLTNSVMLTNGLFTVTLDFGVAAFNGTSRWLDVTVQKDGNGEDLAPRVQILPLPYALYAASAASVISNAISSQGLAFDSNSLSRVSGGVVVISNVLINTNA
jgi:hypothetical protein